ncbi:hypothetical protein B0H63DRAFT_459654 [Podospora didyma]|uniref:Uncharacterized protein n=1 Tax=Podospora didyma TaxID=330526 RepID=A0AAE0P5X5_9PEZI|nr:hypothetical protein B0H63DRAFT_459654 [Podospora didyma]
MPMIAPHNAYSPLCTFSQCLQQVAGQVDRNAADQFAACTSLFGAPVILTSTPPVDVAFATATTTVEYTEIIVSLTTTTSTYESLVTSYTDVFETTTEYTTTQVNLVTTTTTPSVGIPAKKKRDGKKARRGACKPSSALSSSASSSAAEVSSTLPAPLFPIASNCPSLEEYSSACACINAVSTTSVVTEPAAVSTSTIYETVSSAIPSTSVSAVTVAVTTVIVKPATSTLTSTIQTGTATTSTVVSTAAAPVQTAQLIINSGPRASYRLIRNAANGYIAFGTGTGTNIAIFPSSGQQPYLSGQPGWKLYLYNLTTGYGPITFLPDAQVTASHSVVTCSFSGSTGIVGCQSSNGYFTIFQCGTYMYMAPPSWIYAGCTAVDIKVASAVAPAVYM